MSSRPSRGAARLAAILDALPDALLLVNRNGTVVNANAMALEVLEAPGTPLVGRGLLDLLPTFDRSRIPGSVRAIDPRGTRTGPTRMTAHRTDGGVFPVEVTSANLPGGYEDELLMIVVRDLTGKLDVEAELQRQQRQTEMILRAAREGIVGIDAEGQIVLVNPAAARILRRRASDLGGRGFHELLMHTKADGEPLPADESPALATLKTGQKQRRRDQVLWRGGDQEYVVVDMTTAPMMLGETVVGAVVTFSDTTREKSLAERRDQLVELVEVELLSRIKATRGRLKKLADGGSGEVAGGARRVIRQVTGELESLEDLAGEVLVHQRGTTDGAKGATTADGAPGAEPEEAAERVPTTVDDLVDRAMETVTYLARGTGVQFAVEAEPIGVRVDVDAMTRALGHLLADVVAAGPDGSTVAVRTVQDGDVALIEVHGTDRVASGVRVPLARAVVEAHDGTVEWRTEQDHGLYVVELPADAEAAEEVGHSGEHRAVRGRRARGAARPAKDSPTPAGNEAPDAVADTAGGTDDTTAEDGAEQATPAVSGSGEPGQTAGADEPEGPGGPEDDGNAPEDTGAPAAAAALPAVRDEASRPQRGPARLEQVSTPPVPAPPPPGSVAPAGQPAAPHSPFALPAGRPSGDAPGTVPPVPLVPASSVDAGAGAAVSDERHERAEEPGAPAGPEAEDEQARDDSGVYAAVYPPRAHRGRSAIAGQGRYFADAPDVRHNQEQEAPGNRAGEQQGAGPRPNRPPQPREAASAPATTHRPADDEQIVPGGRVNGQVAGQGAQARRRLSTPPAPIPAQTRPVEGTGRRTSVQDRPAGPGGDDDAATTLLPPIPAAPGTPGAPATPQAPNAPGAPGSPGAPAGGGAPGPRRPAPPVPAPPSSGEPVTGADLPTMVAPSPDGMPRRLLVWPEPDAATAGALTARGWSPLLVRSREEVDASVPTHPAALFVDPLTGPITRTALQSLRTAATAAHIPVLVTAGLMQATRDAAFGADPAVLLRSLAPADSAGHASRVLLVEADTKIASAFTSSLERRGMDVVHASSESEAVSKASSVEPNLVVLDLMLVRRRRVGVVDWLRNYGRLHSTPIVVYTTLDLAEEDLHRLETGETVLFLAERSTREDVQQRIVDLLGKIASPH